MATPDPESEYIEETSYVILDLSADLTEEGIRTLVDERGGVALTDLTESPIYAQLGRQTFCGEVDDTVGSYLLFELEERKTDTSGLLSMLTLMGQSENGDKENTLTKWQAKYRYQVDKVIKANQVELLPKTTTKTKTTRTATTSRQMDIDSDSEQ